MKNIDKPLARLEDGISEKKMMGDLNCFICGSSDCYDIIVNDEGSHKMCYSRIGKFQCKKCFKDMMFADNIILKLFTPILKIKRKIGL